MEDQGLFGNKKYREYQPVARHEVEDLGGGLEDSLQMPRATYIPPEGDENRQWRDVVFGVAYLVCAAIGILFGVIVLSVQGPKHPEFAFSSSLNAQNFTLVMTVSVLGGMMYSFIFFMFLRAAAEVVIYVCLFAWTGATLVMALLFAIFQQWLLMCVFVVLFATSLLYVCWAQKRVPFAATVITVAMEAIFAHPHIIAVSYVFFIPEAFFVMLYSTTLYMVMDPTQFNLFWQITFTVFVTFVFFWTSQVLRNVIRVMVSGTVGTWYFYEGSNTVVPYRPTLRALQRACTTSFGSIAFGSLIVAFIRLLRSFVRLFRRTKCACVVACADWLLNIIDGFVQYFNKYAFTYVAIYGMSFLEASKETWHLLRDRGFDVVVNDSLIEGALMFGASLFSVSLGGFIGVIALIAQNKSWATITMGSMYVCFVMIRLATTAVDGAVATIFVCFAENASAMAQTKPELYGQLVSAWRRRWGEVPSHVSMVAPETYKAPHPSEVTSSKSSSFLPNDLI